MRDASAQNLENHSERTPPKEGGLGISRELPIQPLFLLGVPCSSWGFQLILDLVGDFLAQGEKGWHGGGKLGVVQFL